MSDNADGGRNDYGRLEFDRNCLEANIAAASCLYTSSFKNPKEKAREVGS